MTINSDFETAFRMIENVKKLIEKREEENSKIEKESDKKPVAICYAVLGTNQFTLEQYVDAMRSFDKAIELDADNPTIVGAYSGRAKYFLMLNQFKKAQAELEKAKTFFGSIVPSQQDEINKNLEIVNQKLREETRLQPLETPASFPSSGCNEDATAGIKLQKNGGALPDFNVDESRISLDYFMSLDKDYSLSEVLSGKKNPLTEYFLELDEFVRGIADSPPSRGKRKDGSHLYWNAFACCTKAIDREKMGILDEKTQFYYSTAKGLFEELIDWYVKHQISPIPSNIYCSLASTCHKLNLFDLASQHINLAIEKLPEEALYYRIRLVINSDRENLLREEENTIEAEKVRSDIIADETKIRELDPIPPVTRKLLSIYSQLNKSVLFYNEAKLDCNTYLDVLLELIYLKKITMSRTELLELTPVEIVLVLEKCGVILEKEPKELRSSVESSIYDQLSKIGLEMQPKRGETLEPLEVIMKKRAVIADLLVKHGQEVLEAMDISHPAYLTVSKIRVKLLISLDQYSTAHADLINLQKYYPEDKEIDSLIDEVVK
ncbi:MAG: hypothetical protein VX777_07815 [Chlamydiota bacterium]|nr:hypothetical protein [Chlamydiota bacterium]